MHDVDDRQARELVKAYTELMNSPAWHDMVRIMKTESVEAALNMGESPNMPMSAIHYSRGAIKAAKQLLALPQNRFAQLDAQLTLSSANPKP